MKKFLLLFFTFLSINSIYSQATCATADPICVGSVIAPPSGLSNPDFGAIGCNALTTNASWYVFKVGTSGNIDFSLHQGNNAPLYNNNDLNFVCWGPFSDNSNCSELYDFPDGNLNGGVNNIVACSSSVSLTENFTITNANAQDYYVLLVTNLTNQPGTFILEQLNAGATGAGSTDCNIMCGVNLGPTASTTFPSPPSINTISLCSTNVTSYVLHCNFVDTPANAATLSYQWYLDGVLQPALTTKSITITQAGTWRVVVTHPNCLTTSEDSVIIAVSPNNTVTGPTNTSVCINTPISPVITHTTTGATGIGPATGLPPGVFASWSGNTINISGTPTTAGTYNYSIPLTGGCGTVNATGSIIVSPINTVTPTSVSHSFFIDIEIDPIILFTQGATGIGTPINLPPGLTAVWNGNLITISGVPTSAVGSPFTFTIPLIGGCGNVNATGSICIGPKLPPICGGNISPRPSNIGPNLGSPGCLGSAPNGNWFAFKVGTGGSLAFNLHQGNNPPALNNLDVDYICWGPFTDEEMAAGCTRLSDYNAPVAPSNIVGCSYSASPTENINIAYADPGANYVLLITNFSNQPAQFVMTQTGGTGNTTCDVVCGVNLGSTATSVFPDPPAINEISICDDAINSYTLHCNFENLPPNAATLAYQWYLDGAIQSTFTTKSITVTQSGTWRVVVTHPDCGVPSEDSVIIKFGALPVLNQPPTQLGPIGDCNPTFDLTSLIPALLAPLNPADFSVYFFTDYFDALVFDGTPIGSITTPSAFQVNTDTVIYVRAINNAAGCLDEADPDVMSFLLDVRCNADATGNTICTGNTGELTFTGPPNAVVTFTQAANTYNVTLNGSGAFVWTSPSLTTTTVYSLTNVAVGSPANNTPLNSTATITVVDNNTTTVASYIPTLCVNTPILPDVIHTATGATGIGTPIDLPAGVNASWVSNAIVINGTPTVAGTFNYFIPLTGGCGVVNATGTIIVTPNNTVTVATATPILCVNTPLTLFTHTTTGATGIGTPTDLPAGVSATWTSGTIEISGIPTVSGVFNYSIPLTGGCGTANATGTITVNPNNTVTAASATPILCLNASFSITHDTTGATGIGTPTGLPSGVTASWIGNQITISGAPTALGIFNYDIPLTGGCGTLSATGTITVNPDNTVGVASSTPTLCINTLLTITHATTGATGIGTPTGLPAGVTASWGADLITITGSPSVSGTFTYDIPLTGGCGTFSATGTITVTPDNTVTAGSTSTLCVNTLLSPITHTTTGATGIGAPTGLPAGVTASWLGNTITILGTPSVSGSFTYSIPLTGGCGAINATGTITVNANNTVGAASSSPTLCVNTLLATPITHTTTGATGIGTPTNLPAGLTATWTGGQISISGTPTATGTFTYDIPLTGGCGTFSATGTITVSPNNTVTAASSTPTLCVNTALVTAITHFTTGATGIGTPIGLPAGVTASWATDTITINGTPSVSGIFNYSIPLTGGCGATATGTITVTPNNTVSAGSATPTLCVNTPLATFAHVTTGATGIGAPTGLPAGVTAIFNAGGTIEISGTPTATGIFNYSIPLTGGCGTFSAIGTITVNPNNTVTAASSSPILCVNTPVTITHTTTGATGIGTATGLPAGVTASWSAGTLTISGIPTTAVGSPFTYSIPLTGGCGTFSATGTITVIPSNTVTAGTTTTLCVNTVLTPITHTTTGATGIGAPTGLPAGVTASWLGNTITILGTPSVSGSFTYSIPLTGGCGSVNATGVITVNPAPTGITISPPNATTCAGIAVNLTVTGTAGTVITWTGSATPITIGMSGIASVSVFPTVDTIYTLTSATLNGCTVPVLGQSTSVIVSATPQFVNNNISDITICDGELLSLASQLGTTIPGATVEWSASSSNITGTFVASGLDAANNLDQIIDLANALAPGAISIQVIPKIGNCFGTPQTIEVNVTPKPDDLNSVISALPSDSICDNESVNITLVTPLATQFNWQMSAINTNNVNIVGGVTNGVSTNGTFGVQLALIDNLQFGTITFDVTPYNGNCPGGTKTITITVNPIPNSPKPTPEYAVCSEEIADLDISVEAPFIANTTLEWEIIPSANVTVEVMTTSPSAPLVIGQSLEIVDILHNNSDTQGFVIYRVTSKLGNCVGATVDYKVLVDPLPKPVLTDGHICVNQDTGVTYQGYVLDTQLSNPDYAYSWSLLNTTTGVHEVIPGANDATYETMEIGEYQVIVTNTVTGCVSLAVTADVNEVFPATAFSAVVTDAFTDNATITVTVNPAGTGNLIYSLDGGAWQSSNVFTGVQAGPHEIMVEDTEGCTNLTQPITVIDYPKYFTPNGDGIHDTWNVIGINQADAKLYIFDRYGKLIKQISPTENSKGWDGTYNGQQAPSTDYWFTIDFMENNQQKQFKAHFSLKR